VCVCVYMYVYRWEGLGRPLFVFHGCLFWWLWFPAVCRKDFYVFPEASTEGVINVKKLCFIVLCRLRHSPRGIFFSYVSFQARL